MKAGPFVAAAYALALLVPAWLGAAAALRARRVKRRLKALEGAR